MNGNTSRANYHPSLNSSRSMMRENKNSLTNNRQSYFLLRVLLLFFYQFLLQLLLTITMPFFHFFLVFFLIIVDLRTVRSIDAETDSGALGDSAVSADLSAVPIDSGDWKIFSFDARTDWIT